MSDTKLQNGTTRPVMAGVQMKLEIYLESYGPDHLRAEIIERGGCMLETTSTRQIVTEALGIFFANHLAAVLEDRER